MNEALLDHKDTVSIGRRVIINLRFADDIEGLAGSEHELVNLINKIDSTSIELMTWKSIQTRQKSWKTVKGTSIIVFAYMAK